MRILVALGLVTMLAAPAAADSVGWSDPRLAKWSKAFTAGHPDEALAAVEADLRSTSPHPLAPIIWAHLQEYDGHLDAALAHLADDAALARSLGDAPQIYRLRLASPLIMARYDRSKLDPSSRESALRWTDAANDFDRIGDRFEAARAAFERHPDDFAIVFALYRACRALPPGKCRDAIASLGKQYGTAPGGRWLTTIGTANEWIDILEPLHAYLEANPADAGAWKVRGDGLASNHHDDDAIAAYQAALDHYPFDPGAPIAVARVLIHDGKFDEARARIVKWAAGQPKDRRESSIAWMYASALVDDNERGKARIALDDALKHWPDLVQALALRSGLDAGDSRPRQALVDAQRCFDLDARVWCGVRVVDSLLADSRPEEALRKIAELEAKMPMGPLLLSDKLDALERLGRKDERRALLVAATNANPQVADTWLRLADAQLEAKQVDDGVASFLKAAGLEPTAWRRSGLYAKLDAAKGAAWVDKWLANETAKHPELGDLWSDRAGRISGKDTTDARVALWAEARKLAPAEQSTWDEPIDILTKKERWADALALCDEWIAKAPTPGGRASAYYRRVWIAFRKQQAGALTPDDAKRALADADAYLPLGDTAQYHRWRAQILLGLGRFDEMAEALVGRARADLDFSDSILSLFNQGHHDKLAGRGYELLARYVDRNPYSKDRYQSAINALSAYGGAPLLALRFAAAARDHGIQLDMENWLARDLAAVGATDIGFAQGNGHRQAVGESDRYVMWWDGERHGAQKPAALVAFPFDPTTAGNCPLERARKLVTPGSQTFAVICHPSGAITVREVHPLTGKAVLVAEGAAWARATYDARGWNVQRFEDSAGHHVDLHYNAAGHITSVDTNKDHLRIGYTGDVATSATVPGKGTRKVTDAGTETTDERGNKLDPFSVKGQAVAITAQRIFEQVKLLNDALGSAQSSIPQLPFTDPALDRLQAHADPRHADAQLALADYLITHVEDRGQYGAEAEQLLRTVFTLARDKNQLATAVHALTSLDILYTRVRSAGLAQDEFTGWYESIAWLAAHAKGDRAAVALATRLAGAPRTLVPQARWLPRSSLENRGLWQRYSDSAVRPAPVAAADVQALLVRDNGDIVVGTGFGLAVQRAGFWEWFSFDPQVGRWSEELTPGAGDRDQSNVHALAEDRDGRLWVGTNGGLMALTDYAGEVWRARSEADGLPASAVTHLAAAGAGVVVGTGHGAALFTTTSRPLPILGLETASIATFDSAVRGPDAPLVVGTAGGVFAIIGATATKLSDQPVRAITYDAKMGTLIAARDRQLVISSWKPGAPAGTWNPLPGARDIVGETIWGIARMTVDEGADAVAIETDQGISFYRDAHVEHFLLPLADRHPGVRMLASRNARTVLATTAGVYLYELGRTTVIPGRVHDILAAPDIGLTFVATGERVAVIRRDAPRKLQTLDYLEATRLARGPSGEIFVNNDTEIMKYTPASPKPAYVFSARSSTADCLTLYGEPEPDDSVVRNMLVAKDGTLWVASGASLFHYIDSEHVEELNYNLTPDKFPLRSDCVSRVVETIDGKIWAIGSDEGFRHGPNGASLDGGVVELDGGTWKRLTDLPSNAAWFASGYTKVDDTTAIVGSVGGFARHTSTGFKTFGELKDPSYEKLLADHPQLFLGTSGANVGNGMWLFGAAGGVFAYRDGHWFYPERLNWMLPEIAYADRGGRAVHAIAADDDGRIYVGTDLGLLVYDAGGRDAAAFLISQDQGPAAFAELAHRTLVEEAGVLLPKLPSGSEAAMLAAKVDKGQKELAELTHALTTHNENKVQPSDTDAHSKTPASSLTDQLDTKQRDHHKLLATIEDKHPGLFQLLQLNPLDLAALARELGDGVAVVQYLPTRTKLYIQVVTRTSVELREVNVGAEELANRTLLAARRLSSGGSVRGFVLRRAAEQSQPPLGDELHWLYEKLLRPVEPLIAGTKRVYIVPSGALTYLPFGALVRTQKPQLDYAVQHYTFGYVSSMYVLDLMLRRRPSSADQVVIVADPDGTLKAGARVEGQAIAAQFAKHVLLTGDEATLSSLSAAAPKAGILHIATHGKLDHDNPAQSFLLLAKGARLTISDTMVLQLQGTNLVMLSACDSGIGKTGLEYATLARAFMHAGASTVIATLWEIGDESTRELVTRFYKQYDASDRHDAVDALAAAQRDMLASGNPALARPDSWAGFVPFGGTIK